MNLDRAGREYITWPLTGLPEDYASGLEVSIDARATWHPVTVTETTARVLLAGPDASGEGALVFPAIGRYRPVLRLTDNPEVIIRDAGTIDVV